MRFADERRGRHLDSSQVDSGGRKVQSKTGKETFSYLYAEDSGISQRGGGYMLIGRATQLRAPSPPSSTLHPPILHPWPSTPNLRRQAVAPLIGPGGLWAFEIEMAHTEHPFTRGQRPRCQRPFLALHEFTCRE